MLDLFAPSSNHGHTSIRIASRFSRLLSIKSASRALISLGSVENSDVRSPGRIVKTSLKRALDFKGMLRRRIRLGPSRVCSKKRKQDVAALIGGSVR
ncbi:uncharacterized protein LOC116844194 isoform X2 [Odontomachus brunneus]|uniref:uncharacterized protein LOC116844194 isoform X2 n=1 Tax=Odontomachus brunneus TaxID=486640 RepID=UPI0013F18716|nr:uncharacterized protein LOC116844194 isoform X2 [Odontomachus brunneus]